MQNQIAAQGCETYLNVLPPTEVTQYLQQIENTPQYSANFRANQHLFAIRNLLGEIPSLQTLLQKDVIQEIVRKYFLGTVAHCIKAIYFDKPPLSNWVVNWHQDLTINVKNKPAQAPKGFDKWIQKPTFWSVQPPLSYLQNIVTLRLHLDDCNADNGALKVLPASQILGITPSQELAKLKYTHNETVCEVPAGGVLAMSPLLWHASSKNKTNHHRRVIHLEFSNMVLPEGLEWFEKH
jgi:ectoine hydroxylase-related dioxygenase (phytanoyl-CoA dioxygenase family)